MQIASTTSYLSTIGQIPAPSQAPQKLKTEDNKSDSKDLFAANSDESKPAQSATAPTTSTRRGSNVNLLV